MENIIDQMTDEELEEYAAASRTAFGPDEDHIEEVGPFNDEAPAPLKAPRRPDNIGPTLGRLSKI